MSSDSHNEEPMETDKVSEGSDTEMQNISLSAIMDVLQPVRSHWYEIGINIGVPTDELHTIEKTNSDNYLSQVLSKWLSNETRDDNQLVNAVRSEDEGAADQLQKVLEGKSDEIEVKGESEAKGETEVKVEPSVPDLATQKAEISAALKQQLKKGDTWFLVDVRWIKQWKKFVGYDTWDQSSAGKESANPGPLDNSNIFQGGVVREHLMDELDYYLLPESAWNKLSAWYELSSGSKVVPRKVVEYGMYMKHCKVEVYLLEFKLCMHPHLNEFVKKEFSRSDTVSMLESSLRAQYSVDAGNECRVWHRYMTHTYELLSKPDQSLQDAGLYNGQTIVIEKKNSDGTWPRTTSTTSSSQHPTRSSDDTFASSNSTRTTGSGSSYYSGGSYWSSSYSQQPTTPGLCGLSNLGNTCFMNSALQCLSNSAHLTEYFLGTETGYKPFKKHINKDNPLGMGGAIAEAYVGVLEEVWSGKVSVTAPRHFKTQVGRYAPQFVGYAQHDSHELLAFLLDGLHEDLNLVKKKPYVDMTVKTEGREEKDIAQETWFKYLQRNQSVIVKLFQGQLKSTLVCPDCSQVSKTFDPFMFLSLPLPIKKTRTISVFLVRAEPIAPVVKYKLKLPKRGCMFDLKKELGTLTEIDPRQLAVVDVYNSRFHRIYSDRDPLSNILEKDDIYCYELEGQSSEERKMVHVPVYMRAQTERQYSYQQYSRYYNLFGLPTVAYVPAECTYRTLYTAIVSKMRRYCKLWSEVKGQNVDKEESENENGTSENRNEMSQNGNEPSNEESENGHSENEKKENDQPAEGDSPDSKPESMDHDGADSQKDEDKDQGERDLFKLVVVNSYGSQEIKKLVDDPKRTLQLSGSTYIACDWDSELQEKCYDEELAKDYSEHESCHDNPAANRKNIHLMDCFKLFTVKETLGKEDTWFCPKCKDHVQASKKFDLWSLPEVLVVHLKRFSYDRYWRDKLDVLIDFPVTGLDLSEYALCPDDPEPIYDLYAVSNHFGGMGGGHYTAYAKNKDNGKWYNFDDSHVSETSEDRLVTAAAYVLFYHRRTEGKPVRSILDRSLSQSFADEGRQLKAKYHTPTSDSEGEEKEQKETKNEEEVFETAETTSMEEPD